MSWRMNWDICCWGQTRILGKELCVPIGMATSYAAPVWELSYLRQSRREPLEKNYLVNRFKLVTGVAETRTWPEDRKVVPWCNCPACLQKALRPAISCFRYTRRSHNLCSSVRLCRIMLSALGLQTELSLKLLHDSCGLRLVTNVGQQRSKSHA